jgi:transposase-like protein
MGRMSRDERLAQAEECLASGMTVKDWCAANEVPAATMYVWLRRLREERECALAPAFVELGGDRAERDGAPVACAPVVVRVGGAEILVPAGACEREVSMVMRAAASL